MLDTFPLALIATVPVPLKFTQALQKYKGVVPDMVGTCAESIVGVVIVGLVNVGVVRDRLEAKYVELIDPAVAGMAFNTLDT
jgi:hypothetical protein